MSSHAPSSEPGPLADHFRKSLNQMHTKMEAALKEEAQKKEFGATGQFPEEKLTQNDEGEIQFGVSTYKHEVIINFGTPVKWIGFNKELAHKLADSIHRHADELPD